MAEVLRLPTNRVASFFSRLGGLASPARPVTQGVELPVEKVIEPVAQEPELATESEDVFAQERGYLGRWTEKTGSNPFSLRSRVGQTAPIGRNRIAIRESGQIIEIDESKKVSLVSKGEKKPLGVTIYELSRKDLE